MLVEMNTLRCTLMLTLVKVTRLLFFVQRGGGRLEAFKFCLYLSIPVTASFIYNYPEHMNAIVARFSYIVYPAEGPRPPEPEVMAERIQEARLKAQAKKEAAAAAAVEASAAAPRRRWWAFGLF